jgi:hypothetical protein
MEFRLIETKDVKNGCEHKTNTQRTKKKEETTKTRTSKNLEKMTADPH